MYSLYQVPKPTKNWLDKLHVVDVFGFLVANHGSIVYQEVYVSVFVCLVGVFVTDSTMGFITVFNHHLGEYFFNQAS